jgi:hypothetical protein
MKNTAQNAPQSPIGFERPNARATGFVNFASIRDPLVAKISRNGGR